MHLTACRFGSGYTPTVCVSAGARSRVLEDGCDHHRGWQDHGGHDKGVAGSASATPPRDAGGKLPMPGNICSHTHFYGALARGLSSRPSAQGLSPRSCTGCGGRWINADDDAVLYSAGLSGRCDPQRHHDRSITMQADGGSTAAWISSPARGRSGRAARLPVLRGDGPQRVGRRGRQHCGERPIHPADTPARCITIAGRHIWAAIAAESGRRRRWRCVYEAEALGDVGFHIHAAEGPADEEDSLAKYGLRTIDRLQARGILGSHHRQST